MRWSRVGPARHPPSQPLSVDATETISTTTPHATTLTEEAAAAGATFAREVTTETEVKRAASSPAPRPAVAEEAMDGCADGRSGCEHNCFA